MYTSLIKVSKIRNFITLSLLVISLGGCQTIYNVFPPSTDLHFKVDKTVNPDLEGRPSPVVVKVYELSSRTVFDTKDFFTLYDSPEKVLKTDLLKKVEFEFEPGKRLDFKTQFLPTTEYLGIVVAFRDVEKARWRTVFKVDPTGYDDLYVYIEKLAIYIREFDLEKRQNKEASQ